MNHIKMADSSNTSPSSSSSSSSEAKPTPKILTTLECEQAVEQLEYIRRELSKQFGRNMPNIVDMYTDEQIKNMTSNKPVVDEE